MLYSLHSFISRNQGWPNRGWPRLLLQIDPLWNSATNSPASALSLPRRGICLPADNFYRRDSIWTATNFPIGVYLDTCTRSLLVPDELAAPANFRISCGRRKFFAILKLSLTIERAISTVDKSREHAGVRPNANYAEWIENIKRVQEWIMETVLHKWNAKELSGRFICWFY